MKCAICYRAECGGHHPSTILTPAEAVAQTVADLRAKAANLVALAGGLQIDLEVVPHTEQVGRLRLQAQAHLAQAQAALDVLQGHYPLRGLPQ